MSLIQIVHCSGYSLAENPDLRHVVDRRGGTPSRRFGDWEHVCWGDETKHLMGRIPTAVWVARMVRANLLVWSTGCTRESVGLWEAEYMYELALNAHRRLKREFPGRFRSLWASEEVYRRWLRRISVFETTSVNTADSMELAALEVKELTKSQPAMVHLVSSANHVSRVMRDAIVAFNLDGSGKVTLAAVPAETSYGGKEAVDTVVRDLGD